MCVVTALKPAGAKYSSEMHRYRICVGNVRRVYGVAASKMPLIVRVRQFTDSEICSLCVFYNFVVADDRLGGLY